MDTRTMLGIAGTIDKIGFQRACISSGAAFDTSIRFLREDPWERFRLLRTEMPRTPLEFLVRGRNLIGWKRYPDDVAALTLRCLRRAGFDWMLIFDGLNDYRNIAFHIRCAKKEGLKVSAFISYADSPVHTDQYWIRKTRELVALEVDVVNFGDPAGLLNAARVRTLVPALLAAIDGRAELLVNIHTSTGQALDCYGEALRGGARALASAAMPLANSESIPATADVISLAHAQGLNIDLDERLVAEVDAYFTYVALRDGRPTGKPIKYDEQDYKRYLGHQIPGGMMSNFVRQHREAGTLDRLPEILEEMGRVRAELGFPPMVTPWSQLVGVQATLNVTSGVRYGTVPDELKLYARGSYGELPAPIDPNVLDRMLAGGSAAPIDPSAGDGEPVLPRVRAQNPFVSDEELMLRIFYDESTLDGYRKGLRPLDPFSVAKTPLSSLIEAGLRGASRGSLAVKIPDAAPPLAYADVVHAATAIQAAESSMQFALSTPAYSLSIARVPDSSAEEPRG
jgi:oxaloacetate decarboxylase (Na+ extruding) subunit alpha